MRTIILPVILLSLTSVQNSHAKDIFVVLDSVGQDSENLLCDQKINVYFQHVKVQASDVLSQIGHYSVTDKTLLQYTADRSVQIARERGLLNAVDQDRLEEEEYSTFLRDNRKNRDQIRKWIEEDPFYRLRVRFDQAPHGVNTNGTNAEYSATVSVSFERGGVMFDEQAIAKAKTEGDLSVQWFKESAWNATSSGSATGETVQYGTMADSVTLCRVAAWEATFSAMEKVCENSKEFCDF